MQRNLAALFLRRASLMRQGGKRDMVEGRGCSQADCPLKRGRCCYTEELTLG